MSPPDTVLWSHFCSYNLILRQKSGGFPGHVRNTHTTHAKLHVSSEISVSRLRLCNGEAKTRDGVPLYLTLSGNLIRVDGGSPPGTTVSSFAGDGWINLAMWSLLSWRGRLQYDT